MELSEYIAKRGEEFNSTEDLVEGSIRTIEMIDEGVTEVSAAFLQEDINGIPISWKIVIENLGLMMRGITDFCLVNSIDLLTVLDRDSKQTEIVISLDNKEIIEDKPFNE